MKQYNPDIHRRRGMRLREYDYTKDGLYFITICTYEREPLFGGIANAEMSLSKAGAIAAETWLEISARFSNVELHDFIIMPNHVHGIIEIVGARFIAPDINPISINDSNEGMINSNECSMNPDEDVMYNGAINRAPTGGGFAGEKNPMHHMNLARIIRWYKGRTTHECRKAEFSFAWQRNYYEHIIRDEEDLNRVTEYIRVNPCRWNEDRFYTELV
ncbi:MAG: hypothetical protein FWD70_04495 [Desulfuromonadales bacterium]|nr:hypothetical protein [Desulfuromonadales bacterium]